MDLAAPRRCPGPAPAWTKGTSPRTSLHHSPHHFQVPLYCHHTHGLQDCRAARPRAPAHASDHHTSLPHASATPTDLTDAQPTCHVPISYGVVVCARARVCDGISAELPVPVTPPIAALRPSEKSRIPPPRHDVTSRIRAHSTSNSMHDSHPMFAPAATFQPSMLLEAEPADRLV